MFSNNTLILRKGHAQRMQNYLANGNPITGKPPPKSAIYHLRDNEGNTVRYFRIVYNNGTLLVDNGDVKLQILDN